MDLAPSTVHVYKKMMNHEISCSAMNPQNMQQHILRQLTWIYLCKSCFEHPDLLLWGGEHAATPSDGFFLKCLTFSYGQCWEVNIAIAECSYRTVWKRNKTADFFKENVKITEIIIIKRGQGIFCHFPFGPQPSAGLQDYALTLRRLSGHSKET